MFALEGHTDPRKYVTAKANALKKGINQPIKIRIKNNMGSLINI